MATTDNRFQPDYAVPPGAVLAERLAAQRLSHAAFARRCGRSAKLIGEIIAGKAPVEPATALQFEKVLGVDARIWLGIESDYRLHCAREAEARAAAAAVRWSRTFPVRELVRRGRLRAPESDADAVSLLLAFFGVGSIEAWTTRYDRANVAYRHSPSFKSGEAALATWLRLGELDAEAQQCADYDKAEFRRVTKRIRSLTRGPVVEALENAQELCNRSGVALVTVKPLPKTALSGAAWWLSPRKAVIALSARHKTDDHLWFSFFHEAAHILLHGKKNTFVDGNGNDAEGVEAEANDWAANTLVPRRERGRFVAAAPHSEQTVRAFANRQGVAPGIVVGMLQHAGILPWSRMNHLKVKLEWR